MSIGQNDDVAKRIATIHSLPVIPALLQLINEACKQELNELSGLSHLFALDPGLTAKLLHLTNASHFGNNSKVVTTDQCAVMLGIKQLQHIATVSSHHNPSAQYPEAVLRPFWRHSIATAFCARAIAHTRHMKQDYAYTAGLLHRIGDLAILLHPELRSHDLQQNAGLSTCQAGHLLARQWQFADALTDAITHYPAPPDDPHQLLASIVHLASAFVIALDICDDPGMTLPLLSTHAWDTLALTEKECQHIFRETEMHALAHFDLLQI